MSQTAIYPGSFDPITCGHLDIITRAAKIFDKVIVAVLINSSKNATFSVEERVDMINRTCGNISNVEVDSFSGLLVDYAKTKNVRVVVRGLRAMSDFEHEFQMALTNKQLYSDMEMLFMPTAMENLFLSSSVVRDMARYGGDLSAMVPYVIEADVRARLMAVTKK